MHLQSRRSIGSGRFAILANADGRLPFFISLNAWTASESDFDQQLVIDLGVVRNVTRIATQGRAHSQEFVQEYHISYGSNGLDYVQYKAAGGEVKHLTINLLARKELRGIATRGRYATEEYVSEFMIQYSDDGESWREVASSDGYVQMFEGNHDGNTVKRNEFEVPIIAQYIRINPMRWRDKISMRVEIYGCDYVADTLYFNGSSLVKMDLLRDPISASREVIRFRFKTSAASGALLYSRGTQGDYVALQLRDNRLVFNIDLGSGTATSVSVGSLLDDNMWHDVVVSRHRRDLIFSVDRVVVTGRVKGEFSRLNLNRAEPPVVPITFLKEGSYARLRGYAGASTLNVSLEFRTYEHHALIIYHKFKTEGYVKVYLEEGRVKVELSTGGGPGGGATVGGPVRLDNFPEPQNDGRWHALLLTLAPDSLLLALDRRPVRTTKLLRFLTGPTYYIAGGKAPPRGFIGCMRKIAVDGNYRLPTDWTKEEYCCPNEVVFDACQMIDRCNPNPCEHGGSCTQTVDEFTCNCQGTGYAGAVCHTSIHPLSCAAYKQALGASRSADVMVDVDGSGPLPAFPVTCRLHSDGRVVTEVSHSAVGGSPVDGYQEPGSFRQDVVYEASRAQLEALLNRSHTCSQRLDYMCRHSRLLNSPSEEATFAPFAWWVSRAGQRMDSWAGAPPGSRMCRCGVLGNCIDPTKWCNCDAEYSPLKAEEFQMDGGEITEKEYLPVKQLRFGDTGSHLDEKEGRYTLGPLLCEGDDLFSNAVTFRISDAVISLPTFDLGHSGDIYFEFKTTKENAVLLHAKGPTDYIKLSLIGGDQLQFQLQVGDTPLGVSVETSSRLADNNWHSVSIERNRKEARVVVDGALKNEIRTAKEPVRALHLTTALALGASLERTDGFVGCVRALLLNGRPVDLLTYARRGLYGVSEGCHGKCESSPCLNNGTCLERYDGYTCDCRWTAFKGPICADEIGVNLRPNSMVKYDFLGSWRSTISEHIRVGFTTTNPKGFLLGFFSNITGEYLTLMVSNSGYLRVVFDFGFERQEIIFQGKHFGMGQYHDVRLSPAGPAAQRGILHEDFCGVEPVTHPAETPETRPPPPNDLQAELDFHRTDEAILGTVLAFIFLLLVVVAVVLVRALSRHKGEYLTQRERGLKLGLRYHTHQTVRAVLAFIFLLLVVVAVVLVRALSRHKGEYLTQEERGADGAADPDAAALAAATGARVTKRREFFI
ncbi:Neurexin-4 [Papilio machaon]|uniref:Neurexin-4 n=1 Tax=Papilio machaon TaxID=76193 RepID=A0A0N1PG75_PAPMA|nr:Neurexin-4 [Papilio machaon]